MVYRLTIAYCHRMKLIILMTLTSVVFQQMIAADAETQLWKEYKEKFRKSYRTRSEERKRSAQMQQRCQSYALTRIRLNRVAQKVSHYQIIKKSY